MTAAPTLGALAQGKDNNFRLIRFEQLLPEVMIDYFANTSDFSIDKARSKLGYSPQYELRRGMELTEQWARWANLIP